MDIRGKWIRRTMATFDEEEVRNSPGFEYVGKAYWNDTTNDVVVVLQKDDRRGPKWDTFKK